jgi:hypothetical protein
MPAHLMGLLAIGTFYLITIVVGMCATRCLTDEDDEDDDPDKVSTHTHAHTHTHTCIQDDQAGEDTLHLLRLLEHSLPHAMVSNVASHAQTPVSYAVGTSPLDLLSNHTLSSTLASLNQQQLDGGFYGVCVCLCVCVTHVFHSNQQHQMVDHRD